MYSAGDDNQAKDSGNGNFVKSLAPIIVKNNIQNDNIPATSVVRVSELAKIPIAMYIAPLAAINKYPEPSCTISKKRESDANCGR